MNFKFKLQFITALIVLMLPLLLNAQQKTETPVFVPEEGIDGKDVIWWPTPPRLIESMLDIAKAGPGDIVVDLGSGDGRIVIEAAKRGATAIGIEFNPDLVKLSEYRAKTEGVSDKATFLNMDLFEYDLSGATVITMYLLSDLNLRLRPSLLKLKPGTRIVSNTFDMGDWEPDEKLSVTSTYYHSDGSARHNVTNRGYFWVVPAEVQGTWNFMNGRLEISQEFQMISGNFIHGQESIPIDSGKINGNHIMFIIGEAVYSGTIENGRMSGTVTAPGKSSAWEAIR